MRAALTLRVKTRYDRHVVLLVLELLQPSGTCSSSHTWGYVLLHPPCTASRSPRSGTRCAPRPGVPAPCHRPRVPTSWPRRRTAREAPRAAEPHPVRAGPADRSPRTRAHAGTAFQCRGALSSPSLSITPATPFGPPTSYMAVIGNRGAGETFSWLHEKVPLRGVRGASSGSMVPTHAPEGPASSVSG